MLVALLWSRVLVWSSGLLALAVFGRKDEWTGFDPARVTEPYGPLGDALLAPAARWDAVWFLAVADGGYGPEGARPAFFPLYPLLVRAAGFATGSLQSGAVLVSFACAAVALRVVGELARIEGVDARKAVLLVAFFPTAFFLTAIYSEGLFLALSAGAFLAARRQTWWLAGVLGGLAAATRSVGLLLVVPLALLWWEVRPRRAEDLAWLIVVPAGLAAYVLHLELVTGDPTAPFRAQEVWYRSWAGPFGGVWDGATAAWDGVRQLASGSRSPVFFESFGGDPFEAARRNLTDFAFLLVGVAGTAGVLASRLPVAYGAWCAIALLLATSYPVEPEPLMSLPRFVLVLFPIHLWLATTRFADRLVIASGVLLALLSALFTCWVWVA